MLDWKGELLNHKNKNVNRYNLKFLLSFSNFNMIKEMGHKLVVEILGLGLSYVNASCIVLLSFERLYLWTLLVVERLITSVFVLKSYSLRHIISGSFCAFTCSIMYAHIPKMRSFIFFAFHNTHYSQNSLLF